MLFVKFDRHIIEKFLLYLLIKEKYKLAREMYKPRIYLVFLSFKWLF
jgi:hypothetical protein